MDAVLEYPREYLSFVDLFNEGEYFEAHEVLEDLWVVEVAPLKPFYKGLIQMAVALCHWERGNRRGAQGLYRAAAHYLAPYPSHFEGLPLGELRRRFAELFAPLMASEAGPLPQLDPSRIPHLELHDAPR